MERIFIIGVSGCGKTTLARTLSSLIGIPCFDTDDYYWLPDWQERNTEEFMQIIDSITEKEMWIVSGNSSNLSHKIWQRCDTVIWLDYNLLRCLYRAISRSVFRIINNDQCCGGNYESWRQLFLSKNSIIAHVLKTCKKRRTVHNKIFFEAAIKRASDHPKISYLRFTSPTQLDTWLRILGK